jgi:hypothetical protein
VLLDRLLDGTVGQDVYHEKYTALQSEKAEILVELESPRACKRAVVRGGRAACLFRQPSGGDLRQRRTRPENAVLRVVASDATLEGRKARLNLRSAFSLLPKNRSHQNWLTTIRDLRTALANDPLPVEVVKALLAA